MKDIDLTNVKLLPADHLALKDYEFAVGLEKRNKLLEKTILGIFSAGVLLIIYFVIKDESERDKK
jgi:hypothetical protein